MEDTIFVKNKKGLKLAALVNRPGRGVGPFPILIILGGFLCYKEHLKIEMLAKSLASVGIGAIRFDPSGFGESEGTLQADYTISNCVEDSQSIFDYVAGLSWVDKGKIAIFGESMGGILALVLAKNNKTRVRALALVSSPLVMGTDDDLKGKYMDWEKDGYLERESSKYGKLKIPFDFILDARLWNAVDYLKDISMPILVVWCSKDVNVPPSTTKQIFDNASYPKEFKVLEGSDHFLNRDPKIMKRMVNYTVEFLTRKLK